MELGRRQGTEMGDEQADKTPVVANSKGIQSSIRRYLGQLTLPWSWLCL